MCGGICGPGGPCEGATTYSKTCRRCNQLLWNCKCISAYSVGGKQTKKKLAPMKKAMIEVSNEKRRDGRKLTKPLRKK